MRKLLISIVLIASFFTSGCAQDPIVERLPWVYRIDIQQGNVVTQDEVNQITPGISKREVLFIMGTPVLNDPLHPGRWDYIYLFEPGSKGGEPVQKRLSLFFEEDKLIRINGNLRPDSSAGDVILQRQVTVAVPPQEPEDLGILTRLWRWWTGFGDDNNEQRSLQTDVNPERGVESQKDPRVF